MKKRYILKSRKVTNSNDTITEWDIIDTKHNKSYGSTTPVKPDAQKLCDWLNKNALNNK